MTFQWERMATGMPFGWDESYGARLGVMRQDDPACAVTWFDVDPGYVFHVGGAHTDDARPRRRRRRPLRPRRRRRHVGRRAGRTRRRRPGGGRGGDRCGADAPLGARPGRRLGRRDGAGGPRRRVPDPRRDRWSGARRATATPIADRGRPASGRARWSSSTPTGPPPATSSARTSSRARPCSSRPTRPDRARGRRLAADDHDAPRRVGVATAGARRHRRRRPARGRGDPAPRRALGLPRFLDPACGPSCQFEVVRRQLRAWRRRRSASPGISVAQCSSRAAASSKAARRPADLGQLDDLGRRDAGEREAHRQHPAAAPGPARGRGGSPAGWSASARAPPRRRSGRAGRRRTARTVPRPVDSRKRRTHCSRSSSSPVKGSRCRSDPPGGRGSGPACRPAPGRRPRAGRPRGTPRPA